MRSGSDAVRATSDDRTCLRAVQWTQAQLRACDRRPARSRSAAVADTHRSTMLDESRVALVETLSAATTRPSRPCSGAAIERSPGSSSPSTSDQPCSRTRPSSSRSAARSVSVRSVRWAESDAASAASAAASRQSGQQHAAHAGRERREPRADRDAHAHDAARGHARDVDDVGAVEHRGRDALVDVARERLEVRLHDLGQRQRRQVAEAEFEHPRGEPEVRRASERDVAERSRGSAGTGGRPPG